MNKLKWSNLKSFKCPYDSKILDDRGDKIVCPSCHMVIGKVKFDEIVKGLYGKESIMARDNLAELNNFGYEEVTEGFNPDTPNLDDIL